jgi:Gpi18-like mannosyltransferase
MDPLVRQATLVFMGVRLALTLMASAARLSYTGPMWPDPVLRPYWGIEPISGGLAGLLLEPWQRWDTLHFIKVATVGYTGFEYSLHVQPLYPFLIRVVGMLLDQNWLLASIAVSNVAYLLGLIYFLKLVSLDFDEGVARRSVICLALFPTAFFFLAGYSESLFLLTSIASFYYARRGRWIAAGVAGFLAALTRWQGALLIVPLAYEAWQQRQIASGSTEPQPVYSSIYALSALALVMVGMLAFPAYVTLGLHQPPWQPFVDMAQKWGAYYAPPWTGIVSTIQLLRNGRGQLSDAVNLFAATIFIVLTLASWARLPRTYALYSSLVILVVLLKVGEIEPLLSASRYLLAAFPAFIVLGQFAHTPMRMRFIVYPSFALLLFLTGEFAIWGWIA